MNDYNFYDIAYGFVKNLDSEILDDPEELDLDMSNDDPMELMGRSKLPEDIKVLSIEHQLLSDYGLTDSDLTAENLEDLRRGIHDGLKYLRSLNRE